jgi:ATP-dependent Clp protease protease subunit
MMSKLAAILAVAGLVLLSIPVSLRLTGGGNRTTVERTNDGAKEAKVPKFDDLLGLGGEVKQVSVKKTLVLEAKNTLVFRGPVTGSSVGSMMKKLSDMSRNLAKSDVIYLVLDTPGGSIFDGVELIDFMEGIPQEVRTVTLFAASMGFQIAENNPGKRIIARNGTLMSHRATGGLDGQFDGELETRYRMVKRKIDYIDSRSAARVGLSFDAYKAKVIKEWWIHGFDAIEEKVADEVALIQCGSSMNGTEELKVMTFFGPIEVVFDKCPLIREPVEIRLGGIKNYALPFVQKMVTDMFYDKAKFVKDVVNTNNFYKIFP